MAQTGYVAVFGLGTRQTHSGNGWQWHSRRSRNPRARPRPRKNNRQRRGPGFENPVHGLVQYPGAVDFRGEDPVNTAIFRSARVPVSWIRLHARSRPGRRKRSTAVCSARAISSGSVTSART